MPKQQREHIIDAIIKEIDNGADRKAVVAKFCKKLQKSARTVDTYWKDAKKQHLERLNKASKAADDIYLATKTKAAIEAVMSRQERLELLTKIAKGEFENETKKPAWNNQKKVFEIVTVREKADHNGVMKAIAEMNKMEGDYAPDKVAHTDTKGNDIPLEKLPTEALVQLEKILSLAYG